MAAPYPPGGEVCGPVGEDLGRPDTSERRRTGMAEARQSEPAAETSPPSPRRRPRWIRFVVMAALTFAAVLYGVVPSLVSARNDIDLVHSASLLFLAVALLLQVA